MAELETDNLEASLLADSPAPQRPIFDIAKFKSGGGADFREANGYSWDFVMVMPCSKPQDAEKSARFISRLREAVRWRRRTWICAAWEVLCWWLCVVCVLLVRVECFACMRRLRLDTLRVLCVKLGRERCCGCCIDRVYV
jgi:hypothetical protein